MPVFSISEYLKRVQRNIDSVSNAKVINVIMIDGRDVSIDQQGRVRLPRICILSENGIELRTIRKLNLFDKIKEHFTSMLSNGLYPIMKLKLVGNIVTDVELNNRGIKIEDAARKILRIAEQQKKYSVFKGEGTFYWRGEQGVIENDGESVLLPPRLLTPSALAQVLDGKRIKYFLLTVPGSIVADAFIVTEVSEREEERGTGTEAGAEAPIEETVVEEEQEVATEDEEDEIRSEFNELISQAVEVGNGEDQHTA